MVQNRCWFFSIWDPEKSWKSHEFFPEIWVGTLCPFSGELGLAASALVFFLHLLRQRTLVLISTGLLQPDVLPATPPIAVSTDWRKIEALTSTGKITNWPHPFLIHCQTAKGSDTASFAWAVLCQYPLWLSTPCLNNDPVCRVNILYSF